MGLLPMEISLRCGISFMASANAWAPDKDKATTIFKQRKLETIFKQRKQRKLQREFATRQSPSFLPTFSTHDLPSTPMPVPWI
jgi:hypothetical protein